MGIDRVLWWRRAAARSSPSSSSSVIPSEASPSLQVIQVSAYSGPSINASLRQSQLSLSATMMSSSAALTAARFPLLRSVSRITVRPSANIRCYSSNSPTLRAAVKDSPSATHPNRSASSDGAGPGNNNGISVHERLENSTSSSLASDNVESFGFEISGKESTTSGKAKSQGRPIYLDMQVRLDSMRNLKRSSLTEIISPLSGNNSG